MAVAYFNNSRAQRIGTSEVASTDIIVEESMSKDKSDEGRGLKLTTLSYGSTRCARSAMLKLSEIHKWLGGLDTTGAGSSAQLPNLRVRYASLRATIGTYKFTDGYNTSRP